MYIKGKGILWVAALDEQIIQIPASDFFKDNSFMRLSN
jgi:hypothetical protein